MATETGRFMPKYPRLTFEHEVEVVANKLKKLSGFVEGEVIVNDGDFVYGYNASIWVLERLGRHYRGTTVLIARLHEARQQRSIARRTFVAARSLKAVEAGTALIENRSRFFRLSLRFLKAVSYLAADSVELAHLLLETPPPLQTLFISSGTELAEVFIRADQKFRQRIWIPRAEACNVEGEHTGAFRFGVDLARYGGIRFVIVSLSEMTPAELKYF